MESLKEASKATGIPKSTIHHHDKRRKKRAKESGTDKWDSAWGQNYLKRMIISVIYTFGIKGGVGAGRISEHLGHLQIAGVAAISESSIQRLTNEISSNILWYKQLEEEGLESESKEELSILSLVNSYSVLGGSLNLITPFSIIFVLLIFLIPSCKNCCL